MKKKWLIVKYILLAILCFIWAFPLLWAVITAFRPASMAAPFSLEMQFTLDNLRNVFGAAPFLTYGLNTLAVVGGILAVQLFTVTLGAYALARMEFAGKGIAMAVIMMQIIIPADILILPNYQTLKALNLIDSRLGIMIPYFASSMGLLLLRQAFKSVPSAIVDAARMDGATLFQTLRYIFIPCSKAAYLSFAICSVSTHWNSFLWPMIVINSPQKRPLTMGLVLFAKANDSGPMWALVTSATLLVMFPLFLLFCIFQKQFVSSFVTSGIK
ncbi:MAG: carbohydrate ABC transporter permease [Hungatella sp.]|nr:carbohydrate ABC transporter permease [Hungatella sp.]